MPFATEVRCSSCHFFYQDYFKKTGTCKKHEEARSTRDVCEHHRFRERDVRNVVGNCKTTHPPNKERLTQPLMQRARAIAMKRGTKPYSERWNEILHTAHAELCGAHKLGQKFAAWAIEDMLAGMKPQPDPLNQLTLEQQAQTEILDAAIDAISKIEPAQPERKSTD